MRSAGKPRSRRRCTATREIAYIPSPASLLNAAWDGLTAEARREGLDTRALHRPEFRGQSARTVDVKPPFGDGNQGTSYMHLVVLMLEWQALEDLLGADRATGRDEGMTEAGR